MALTAALTRASIISPGTSSNWTDDTVYGSPNQDRADVAVYLTAYKVNKDLVETPLEVTAFDPATATTFTTENGIDGHHKYYFIIVDDWDIAVEYTKYDIVWDASGEEFYEYINDSPTTGNALADTDYFSPVVDPCALLQNVGTASEPGNVTYQIINKIVDYITSVCYVKAASRHAKENCGGKGCGCSTKLGSSLHKIRDLFNTLTLNESLGQFTEGERNARLAEKWCDDCGCLSQ